MQSHDVDICSITSLRLVACGLPSVTSHCHFSLILQQQSAIVLWPLHACAVSPYIGLLLEKVLLDKSPPTPPCPFGDFHSQYIHLTALLFFLSVCSCLAASLCREIAGEQHETTLPAVSRRLSSTCPRNATVYTAHPSSVIPREMKNRLFFFF